MPASQLRRQHQSLTSDCIQPRSTLPTYVSAGSGPRPPPSAGNAALPAFRSTAPEWRLPIYNERDARQNVRLDLEGMEELPIGRTSMTRMAAEDLRQFRPSEDTLRDGSTEDQRFSLSSYQHPYDIPPPANTYAGRIAPRDSSVHPVRGTMRRQRSVSFAGQPPDDSDRPLDLEKGGYADPHPRQDNSRGVLSQLMEWHHNERSPDDDAKRPSNIRQRSSMRRNRSRAYSDFSVGCSSVGEDRFQRNDSMGSLDSQGVDGDDPRITGSKGYLDDPEEVRRNALRQMDYKARRKERARVRIEFNITSIVNRQAFLLKLARSLMTFGAPSHRIESQLVAAAKILEVDAEFIHLPGVIICSFGDEGTKTSETHFVKCGGRLSLGSLHKVHLIYRSVVHDEISAKEATKQLSELLSANPLYSTWFRCVLAFLLSALICPLAFGGSFVDMWIAGVGAFILCALQLGVASKSALYANVFEITIAIFTSFTARALSSIRGSNQLFCYTAISSAGIIGILPGYLILTSSLELASKNIVCGSVKMVYALIYTLFLGFGLQIGSDIYLLLDSKARHQLQTLATDLSPTTTLVGSFLVDNNTDLLPSQLYRAGTFTFTDAVPLVQKDIVEGCYRPKVHPWFLQPFPWWSQFIIVPIFSTLSSLANLQPWKSKQLPVMVIISCASYATNKVANHYIFNRSDIVSAIGAFTVGLLGNIYSRKMGGTAFTSMVTGVLFLVPSGLSQAGGITAQGSGIDIGGAMIAVTIGITVGLFMSQAFVYMFGSRKNAAVFSF